MKLITLFFILASNFVALGDDGNELLFFQLMQKLDVTNGLESVAAKGEFSAASASIGESYGVSGWAKSDEKLFLSVYRSYPKNWNNPNRETSRFLWVDQIDVAKILNMVSQPTLIAGFLKSINASSAEPVEGLLSSKGGVVILIDLVGDQMVVAKRNLNPRADSFEAVDLDGDN